MSLEPLALDNKVWTTKSELRRKFVRAKKLKFYKKSSREQDFILLLFLDQGRHYGHTLCSSLLEFSFIAKNVNSKALHTVFPCNIFVIGIRLLKITHDATV